MDQQEQKNLPRVKKRRSAGDSEGESAKTGGKVGRDVIKLDAEETSRGQGGGSQNDKKKST